MKINIKKEFSQDYITRMAGEKLRQSILAAEAKGEKIEIDFSNMVVASTSFFDESMAKLALEGWDKTKFNQWIHLKNINPRDQKLLEELCQYRGLS